MNKNTDSKGDRFMPVTYLSMIILVVVCIIVYCLDIPETLFGLTDKEGKVQPNNVNGEFFKFLLLVVGGIIAIYGLLVNYKRLEITNKQIELQTEQVKIAIDNQKNVVKQIQLAEKTQINTRFKDAAQLLASEHTSAILSGIYALDQIAVEVSKSDDEQYKGYVQVVHEILCAYLRENSVLDKEGKPIVRKQPDIVFQTIVSQLFVNNKEVYNGLEKYLYRTYLAYLDLEDANLERVSSYTANLQGAILYRANLQEAWLVEANLREAILIEANLQGANLRGTEFYYAKFYKTDFSNAKMDRNTNFDGTRLAGYSIEEITRPGRSIELTS